MNGTHTLAAGSVLIGLIVYGLKYFAYYLTGRGVFGFRGALDGPQGERLGGLHQRWGGLGF